VGRHGARRRWYETGNLHCIVLRTWCDGPLIRSTSEDLLPPRSTSYDKEGRVQRYWHTSHVAAPDELSQGVHSRVVKPIQEQSYSTNTKMNSGKTISHNLFPLSHILTKISADSLSNISSSSHSHHIFASQIHISPTDRPTIPDSCSMQSPASLLRFWPFPARAQAQLQLTRHPSTAAPDIPT
jgi:hypothetical protein